MRYVIRWILAVMLIKVILLTTIVPVLIIALWEFEWDVRGYFLEVAGFAGRIVRNDYED